MEGGSVDDRQAYWKEDRDRLAKEEYFKLLECSYRPETFFSDTPTVSVRVYGVPAESWKKSGVTHDQLAQIVEESLTMENAWISTWGLSIAWSSRFSQLECKFVVAATSQLCEF